MKDPFDVWLEQQLAEDFSHLGRRPVRPFSTGRLPRLRLALPAALGAKAVAGFAVAALAAGGGVAFVKTVAPDAFGQSVKTHATTTCPSPGSGPAHGACVSNFAVNNNPGASHRSATANPGGGGNAHSPSSHATPNSGTGHAPGNSGPPAGHPTPTQGGKP